MTCLAIIDFEATGLSPANDRITQVACVLVMPDQKKESYCEYIKADRPMSEGASKVTGITDEMLEDADPFAVAIKKFFAWMDTKRGKSDIVLVAHNGFGYDYPIMFSEMCRNGMNPYYTLHKIGVSHLFDSLKWAKTIGDHHLKRDPVKKRVSRALGSLHKSLLHCDFDNAHDALADCEALYRVCNCPYTKEEGREICYTECDDYMCYTLKDFITEKFTSKRKRNESNTKRVVQQKTNEHATRTSLSGFYTDNKGGGDNTERPAQKHKD